MHNGAHARKASSKLAKPLPSKLAAMQVLETRCTKASAAREHGCSVACLNAQLRRPRAS